MKEVVFTKKIILIYLSILLLLMIVVFSIYSFSDIKYIGEISIEGNDYISDDVILNKLNLSDDQWFLFVKERKLKENILTLPYVKDAFVEKTLPNTIHIVIQQYDAIGCMDGNQPYILFSNNSVEKVDSIFNDYCINKPLFSGFDNQLFIQYQDDFFSEYSKIDTGIKSLISEVLYVPNDVYDYRFEMIMEDGNIVYLPLFKFDNGTEIMLSEMMNSYLDYYYSATILYGNNFTGVFNLEVTPYIIRSNS